MYHNNDNYGLGNWNQKGKQLKLKILFQSPWGPNENGGYWKRYTGF